MKIKYLILLSTVLFLFSCKKKEGGTGTVNISGSMFDPATLTVKKGTTVTWTNKDAFTHTVSSKTGAFESGDMIQNKTFSFTFNTTGTFEYICKYHATMTGTIIVN